MLVMTNAKIFNVTDDSALLKLMNEFRHELTDYVDNKIAQASNQTFHYKGFISTEEPTEDVREGLYWYANSFSENTPPDTNFAWNVKEYSNSSWSKDVEYLPNALDMWYNIATKEVWFYLGTQWEKTDFTVDFDKTFFEQNRQLVTLKNNSITDTQIADNAAIAITKIKDLQNTLRNKVNTADVISIKQGGTEASTVEQAKINLGLDQVDNTADIVKPISNAVQKALNDKADISTVTALQAVVNDKASSSDLASYLPLTGGTITGKFTVNDTATFNNGSAVSGDVTLVDSSKIQFLKNTDLPIPYINTTENTVTNDRILNIVAGDVSIKINTDGTITVTHSKGLGINTTPNTNYSIALEGNAYISGNMFLKSGTIDTNNSNELTYTVDGITKVIAYKSDIAVSSVAGKTGNVVLSKADVGLSNVDNTSDANKPVSNAVQAALANYLPLAGGTVTGALRVNDYLYGKYASYYSDDFFTIHNITTPITTYDLVTKFYGRSFTINGLTAFDKISDFPVNGTLVVTSGVNQWTIHCLALGNNKLNIYSYDTAGTAATWQPLVSRNDNNRLALPDVDVNGDVTVTNNITANNYQTTQTNADVNTLTKTGFYKVNNLTNAPLQWGNMITSQVGDTGFQLYVHYNSSNSNNARTYVRGYALGSNTWSDWEELAKAKNLASYLPLSGGTLTGNLTGTNILGQSLTAKKATTSSVALQVSDAANMTSYLQYLYNSGTPILRLLNYSGNSNKGQIDIKDNSLHISSMGNGTGINTAPDSNYTLKVGGKTYINGDETVTGTLSAARITTTNGYDLYASMVSTGNGAGNITDWGYIMAVNTNNTAMGWLSKTQFKNSLGTMPTATTATNLASAPSFTAVGNNITVTAGGKTSSAFTVPYATTAGSAATATSANSATTATTADGVKNVRDNAQIKVWVGTTAQLPSSRAANTLYMTY